MIYKRDHSSYKEKGFLAEVQSVNWEKVLPAKADDEQLFDSLHNKFFVNLVYFRPYLLK